MYQVVQLLQEVTLGGSSRRCVCRQAVYPSSHLVGGVDMLMIFMIFVVLVVVDTGLACSLEKVMNMK